MKRRSVNPTEWGLQFSMDQGELVEGATRHLRCSGQISAVPDLTTELGIKVVAPNEIRGQMECALANVWCFRHQLLLSRPYLLLTNELTPSFGNERSCRRNSR